ncbi:GNAT family N-acetyltransferase [Streptomyces sp. rh34]|uniref:GNAT family N-acetyltransferase n=1 Tax=Streptomyces sp. rh34 TaxID=2034272 RepID=UPI000BF18595|nr:GNAT family N-acetyltransferase [Streptomyces sp. rh34]
MPSLARHRLSPADTGPALRALRAWTPPDAPSGSLHPGDVGWLLRRDDATVYLWTDARASSQAEAGSGDAAKSAPVAVGFLDGPVLRVTVAPGADLGALAADAEELLVPGNDATDGLPVPGWEPDTEEPWLVFSWTPEPVSSRAVRVGESDLADRALVHRAAFAGSTLSVDHWRRMTESPAGHLAVETLVRTPAGEPAAAATGWFGGAGRCGLLEPVGTHQDHRGHGYGRDAVRGACAALADLGASAVAVLTPAKNEAAAALYRSAGFTLVRENHDWTRPGRG